jgi:hypothetical protein
MRPSHGSASAFVIYSRLIHAPGVVCAEHRRNVATWWSEVFSGPACADPR